MNHISRQSSFNSIRESLKTSVQYDSGDSIVVEGDSLSLIRSIPDSSISLILTDPPYHSTKKNNIYGDKSFKKDLEYVDWLAAFSREWKRILRPNGSLFCFCASEMSAKLEVMFANDFNILAHIVWTKPNEPGFDGWKQKMNKEALRQWYAHSERIIFAEPACDGNLHRSSFANFLRDVRKKAGLSSNSLTELIGAYGRINHGGAVSNWETGRNIPSREQYIKIASALAGTGKVDALPPYEDVIRPFVIDGTKEFTDVWTFPSVRPYKGKHPAEKPLSLLRHAIDATTFHGDIVLDCFAGSGNTAVAAMQLGRRSVSIEIDPDCVDGAIKRLISAPRANSAVKVQEKIKRRKHAPQLALSLDESSLR